MISFKKIKFYINRKILRRLLLPQKINTLPFQSETAMKRIHLIISGKVQGVFYRDFARTEAEKRDITGYVKNLRNGNVEIIAEGEDRNVEKFAAICRKGPLMAFVKGTEIKEEPPTGEFEGFDIRYS